MGTHKTQDELFNTESENFHSCEDIDHVTTSFENFQSSDDMDQLSRSVIRGLSAFQPVYCDLTYIYVVLRLLWTCVFFSGYRYTRSCLI